MRSKEGFMARKTTIRKILAALVFSLVFPVMAQAAPQVDHVMVTDVTTRSFSVVWTANEAASPTLEVYENSDGTGLIGDLTTTPLRCNASLQAVAESLGVMKVQVTGLSADTTYYFRTVTDSASGQTVYPDGADPLLEVTTSTMTVRTDAANNPISNDIIISDWLMADGSSPADGTIVFAAVTGSAYPMTSYVGDCAPSGSALIDLNNMFNRRTAQITESENIDLGQGINLNLVNFRGTDGATQVVHEVPQDNMLAEVKGADPALKAGWNMASIQVAPYDNTTGAVIAPILADMNSVWTEDAAASEWLFYDKNGLPFLNNLLTIDSTVGYWINVLNPTSWKVDGDPSSASKQLEAGWNLIGFNQLQAIDVLDATSPISSELISVWTYDYNTGTWLFYDKYGLPFLNSLSMIEPGKAYWVNVSQNCTL